MAGNSPPSDVTFAAAVVSSWLNKQEQQPGQKVSDDRFKQMTDAERFQYARQFDQTQFQNKG